MILFFLMVHPWLEWALELFSVCFVVTGLSFINLFSINVLSQNINYSRFEIYLRRFERWLISSKIIFHSWLTDRAKIEVSRQYKLLLPKRISIFHAWDRVQVWFPRDILIFSAKQHYLPLYPTPDKKRNEYLISLK